MNHLLYDPLQNLKKFEFAKFEDLFGELFMAGSRETAGVGQRGVHAALRHPAPGSDEQGQHPLCGFLHDAPSN